MYDALKTLHLLVLAVWLGLDVASFVIYGRMRRRALRTEGLRALAGVATIVEIGPRTAWMIMLALGVSLTHHGSWGLFNAAWPVAAWGLALAWLAGTAYSSWVHTTRRTSTVPHGLISGLFGTWDTVLRVTVVLGTAAIAFGSLLGPGPIAADWLSWKLIAFSALVGVGLGIRSSLRTIAGQTRRVLDRAGGDASNDPGFLLRRPTQVAQAQLIMAWLLIVTMVWLAVAKP